MRDAINAGAIPGPHLLVLADCTGVQHGTFLDDATLQLMHDRGIFFDTNYLVLD